MNNLERNRSVGLGDNRLHSYGRRMIQWGHSSESPGKF